MNAFHVALLTAAVGMLGLWALYIYPGAPYDDDADTTTTPEN